MFAEPESAKIKCEIIKKWRHLDISETLDVWNLFVFPKTLKFGFV